jgi:hypothetical protein
MDLKSVVEGLLTYIDTLHTWQTQKLAQVPAPCPQREVLRWAFTREPPCLF